MPGPVMSPGFSPRTRPTSGVSRAVSGTAAGRGVAHAGPHHGRPVEEVVARGVQAVDDPVELRPPVGVVPPHRLVRLELGEVLRPVLGGLRHRPLAARGSGDGPRRDPPRTLRRFLGDEPRRPGRPGRGRGRSGRRSGSGSPAASRSGRGRRRGARSADQPSAARTRRERALAADERPPVALEPGRATRARPPATGPPDGVPGQQHAGLLEDLAHGRDPVGEGRHLVRRITDRPRGGVGREPARPGEGLARSGRRGRPCRPGRRSSRRGSACRARGGSGTPRAAAAPARAG